MAELRMDGVIVKRYRREGGAAAVNKKYYLSLLSAKDFSLSENHDLPFFKDNAQVDASICHDWLCIHDYDGKYVVYNIATKEVRFLPPHKLENPLSITIDNGSGIGYDYITGDYKVVRNFTESHPDGDLIGHTELYSLQNDTCVEIPDPNRAYVCCSGGGVYVGGSFHWIACLSGKITHGIRRSRSDFYVLRFDFATETYSAIPLPPDSPMNPLHYLVDCDGFLGIITYPKLRDSDTFVRPRGVSKYSESSEVPKRSKRSKKRFYELWIWKEKSWTKLYEAALHHVVQPLCLLDGRVSFFQGKSHDKQCDLVMYDWATKEMKRFDICDYPGHLQVFSYVGSGIQLPRGATNGSTEVEEKSKTKVKRMTKAYLHTCNTQRRRKKAYEEDKGLEP